jgi:prefoldin subunit 5
MPTQGDFWVFVFIGLLITNLALLFYVKLDFDKRVSVLSQEVKGVKEKIEKLNAEMKQLEQQTKERIDHITKLLTEPISDESELKI